MVAHLHEQIERLVEAYYLAMRQADAGPVERVTLSAPAFDAKEANRAIRTILSGWISQGPNVQAFEQAFAQYIGTASAIAVNSGSSANLLALAALKAVHGWRDGDEVIVPASTFATVASPIVQVGLVPVYVDVDRLTLNIEPAAASQGRSPRTRALMPVHTLGYPAPMPELSAWAEREGLVVFEDCCEAHGASIDGKKVGSFGAIASFSFFVAHNLTTGEGGMLVTSDPRLEEVCRSLREFGRADQRMNRTQRYYSDERLSDYDRRYVFSRLGYNVRMTDVTAAFGLEQLAKLDTLNAKRRANAAQLAALLRASAGDLLTLPQEAPGYVHTYYTFPMVLTEAFPASRREFCEFLEAHGIETRPLFAGCLPDQPAFRDAPGRVVGDLRQARLLRDRAVFVGIHPGLDERHMRHIAKTVEAFLQNRSRVVTVTVER